MLDEHLAGKDRDRTPIPWLEQRGWFGVLWRHYIWAAIAIVVGLGGMLGILSFAGITFLPAGQPGRTIPIPTLDEAAHGHVVAAAMSWLAGAIALFTYFLNRDQKEQHHREVDRRERDGAELQRIESEFATLARDFTSADRLARVNAAIGMGELARRPDPRRGDEEGRVQHDARPPVQFSVPITGRPWESEARQRDWPAKFRSQKTARNYPYFLRSAHRLCAALYLWDDESSQLQAVRVLQELSAWAKDDGTDEPLLHELVNALAEANRTAWGHYQMAAVRAYARGVPMKKLTERLYHAEEETSEPVGELLLERLEADLFPHQAQEPPTTEEVTDEQAQLYKDSLGPWRGFQGTVTALESGILQLSKPPELDEGDGVWNGEPDVARLALSARRGLRLYGIRLRGSSLFDSPVEGVQLQGASLDYASFDKAMLFAARLQGASLRGVSFVGCSLGGIALDHADGRHADFRYALLGLASLQHGDFRKANFRFANCSEVRLHGANLTDADLMGTNLWLSQMGQRGGDPVIFRSREWDVAKFEADPVADDNEKQEQIRLRQWLEDKFPAETGLTGPVEEYKFGWQPPEGPD